MGASCPLGAVLTSLPNDVTAGRMARMSLHQIIAPIIDFAYPPRCPACGDPVDGGGFGTVDALCPDCFGMVERPGSPACATCQYPFSENTLGNDAQCAACLHDPPEHDGMTAATFYGPVSKDLILSLKYGGRMALADMLGRQIAARLPDFSRDTIIAPVPLHRWRLWKRGYNQAALLGRAIARAKALSLVPDALERVRRTTPLGGMDAAQRRAMVAGSIRANPRHAALLANRPVILVDDVFTTGATTGECVRVLKAAGAGAVHVACYARTRSGEG
ncbi:ComF family protein [Croceicoccus sp. YJ47]|nr:ComF family protein [Croceicoccus sp. YJ47]